MSVLKCACPKCRQPLQVAQALPARIKCPKCGAGFTLSPQGSSAAPPRLGAADTHSGLTPRNGAADTHAGLGAADTHHGGLAPNGAAKTLAGLTPPRPPVPPPPPRPPVAAVPPRPPVAPVPMPNDAGPIFTSDTLVHVPRRKRSNAGVWVGVAVLAVVALAGILIVVLSGFPFGANSQHAKTDKKTDGGDTLPGAGGNGGGGENLPGGTKIIPGEEYKIKAAVEKGVKYLKQRLNDTSGEKLYYGASDDPHIGATALAGMTLVECGVPATDPAVQKAVQAVRDSNHKMTFTYALALSVLFLDRLADPDRKEKDVTPADREIYKQIIRSMALQLIGNQHVTGGWNYYTQLLTTGDEGQLLLQLQTKSFKAGGFKPPADDNVYRDNSISQFVLLALWQARKYGIPVELTLKLEEQIYKDEQNNNGSWDYSKTDSYSRDATTCAGLICLAVGHGIRDEIAEKDAKAKGVKEAKTKSDLTKQPEIVKALKYIGMPFSKYGMISPGLTAKRQKDTDFLEDLNHKLYDRMQAVSYKELKTAYDVAYEKYYSEKKFKPGSPNIELFEKQYRAAEDKLRTEAKRLGIADLQDQIKAKNREADLSKGMIFGADAWGDLYFLWSAERVAVIFGLDKIGGRDWYGWGKNFILKNQKPDGSWKERFPGVPDTCFALLFLKRVNIVKDLTDKLQRLLAAISGQHGPPQPARKEA